MPPYRPISLLSEQQFLRNSYSIMSLSTFSLVYLIDSSGLSQTDPASSNFSLLSPLSTKTTYLITKLTLSFSTFARLLIPSPIIYYSTNYRTLASLIIFSTGFVHIYPTDLNRLLSMAPSPPNSQSPQAYRKAASLAPSCLSSLSMTYQILYNQLLLSYLQMTKCIKAISSPHDSILLQDDLTALTNWSSNWELTFSNSKCKLLSIPPPNQLVHSANYSINNSIINSTSLHRDLGVLVSNNLTWDEHYSAIISRAYKSLYFIRRATSKHSPSTKLSLLRV